MNTTTTPTPTRRKKYWYSFVQKFSVFIRSEPKEIQASLEARKKRRDLFLKIKKRTNSLFDRRKTHPPFWRRGTRETPQPSKEEKDRHAFKKRRRDTPVTRGSARARDETRKAHDATGGQGEKTLNCRRHACVGGHRGRQRRRRRRTFKVDDVDSKKCWRSETPVR